MKYLNEKIHQFYRDQSFYKAARDYEPELKKIIVQFLRKKGVSKLSPRFGDSVEYDNLPSDPKERSKRFKNSTDSTTVNRGFFAAKEPGYGDDVEILPFIYKDKKINISIMTDQEFFIDGHNLKISIKDKNDSNYGVGTTYQYKLNLMSKVENVLNEIWKRVGESLDKLDKGITDKEKRKTINNKKPDSGIPDIQRLVKTYLQQWSKKRTLKSGKVKRTKYTDIEKLPIEFFVSINNNRSSNLSSIPRGKPSFNISYKMKARKFKLSNVLEQFPELRSLHQAFIKATNNSKNVRRYVTRLESIFSDYKLVDSSHYEMYNKLEYVIQKMAMHGYKPTNTRQAFKRGDYNSITFNYSEDLKKLADRDLKSAKKEALEGIKKKYDRDLKDEFFNKTINLEDKHFFYKYYLDRIFR